MKNYQPSRRVVVTTWSRDFLDTNYRDGGYSFDCDETGAMPELNPAAAANLAMCLADPDRYEDQGVGASEHSYREAATGECDCGRTVSLGGFTNTCRCGADWNASGQRLAPRSQWGEETGESLSDILRIA